MLNVCGVLGAVVCEEQPQSSEQGRKHKPVGEAQLETEMNRHGSQWGWARSLSVASKDKILGGQAELGG